MLWAAHFLIHSLENAKVASVTIHTRTMQQVQTNSLSIFQLIKKTVKISWTEVARSMYILQVWLT